MPTNQNPTLADQFRQLAADCADDRDNADGGPATLLFAFDDGRVNAYNDAARIADEHYAQCPSPDLCDALTFAAEQLADIAEENEDGMYEAFHDATRALAYHAGTNPNTEGQASPDAMRETALALDPDTRGAVRVIVRALLMLADRVERTAPEDETQ